MGSAAVDRLSRFARVRDAGRSDKLPRPAAAGSVQVRWRDIVITAYGPTILIAVGQGAILPLVALSARELGASVGMAAFIVALIGIGQLVGDLPAGALAARIGEKRALITACALDAVALLGAFLAESVVLLAIAITVTGIAGAVFGLARQAYLTEAIPIPMRARALSTLGGTFRIGLFIGPFIAAAIVTRWSIGAAYGFAAIMSLAAAVLTAFLPDVTTSRRTAGSPDARRHRSVISVLLEHRRVLLTLGLGILIISAARATRQSIVPLWAQSIGLSAATTSVIFGISAGVDMLLFYPGGAIMDRFGRVYVAVPSMIVLGLGFLLLPLTSGATSVGLVAALMGLGQRHLVRGHPDSRCRCVAVTRSRPISRWLEGLQRSRQRRWSARGQCRQRAGDIGSGGCHDGVAHLGWLGMADQVGACVRPGPASTNKDERHGNPSDGDE